MLCDPALLAPVALIVGFFFAEDIAFDIKINFVIQ